MALLNLTDTEKTDAEARHLLGGRPMPPATATNEHLVHQHEWITWYDDDLRVPLWVVYREFLTRWIKPHWGSLNIRDVRTVAVESWLRQLRRQDGEDLANSTKAKIRSVMSVLFNHAIRYEWLEQGRNPITFVRQSAQRKNAPAVLEPTEIQSLLSELESRFD